MTVLRTTGLRAGYGGTDVLHGLDLTVDEGEVVVLLGANGAGKTTTLRAIAHALPFRGTVDLLGSKGAADQTFRHARRGVAYLPEERGIVRALTVEANLKLARLPLEECYALSPELLPIHRRKAGQLSGGEQQILALTRAIVGRPRLLLADELSFGLSPVASQRMLHLARRAADGGAGVLLVEQYARQALAVADRAYVVQRGEIRRSGPADEMARDIESIERDYLGVDVDSGG